MLRWNGFRKKEEGKGNHMPPKQRITREMILDKSFAMFMSEGMEAVNARSVAKALNCSTQPIFSYFSGMDDLKNELDQKARSSFEASIANSTSGNLSLEGVCNAYVQFAGEQPRLFAHLFLKSGSRLGSLIDDDLRAQLAQLESSQSGITGEQAKELCESVWVFAHGLAAARAVGMIDVTDQCVSDSLSRLRESEVLRFRQQ